LEIYLPKQLSQEEIEAEVKKIIAEVGATSMREMGKVMGTARKQLAGKADGRVISEIVKNLSMCIKLQRGVQIIIFLHTSFFVYKKAVFSGTIMAQMLNI
jgi:hypothetical protein